MAIALVVDDSAVDRRLAGGILEKQVGLQIEYASNGVEALEAIRRQPPDIVLSDLQMPEMDGLALVTMVRSDFPLIPVVLMTGHGSEAIAVQALQRGASSYVSKSRLVEELPEIVETVLALAKADRTHDRLVDCLVRSDTEYLLPNDSSLIYPLVDQLQRMVTRMKFCDDTGRIRVGVALEEALLNALYHGNLELTSEQLRASRTAAAAGKSEEDLIEVRRRAQPYCDRRIHVRVLVTTEETQFIIRDEGPGFRPEDVPDPTAPENLEHESGRGLLLMRSFMEEVHFSERGNQVTLIKRRDPECEV